MFVVIASICFGFLSGAASSCSPPDYTLEFPKQGDTDYVQIWGMRDLTEFTVCFWLKTTSERGTPFSYASKAMDNELAISFNGKFAVNIGNALIVTPTSANDGQFHQICVTWRNIDGQIAFYKDGKMELEKPFRKGYTIKAGGSLTLGQDQDNLGGGFEGTQSFQGMLTNVNVWSYTLPPKTIMELSRCCMAGKGDVYEWADFIYGIKGNPRLVTPAGCPCDL